MRHGTIARALAFAVAIVLPVPAFARTDVSTSEIASDRAAAPGVRAINHTGLITRPGSYILRRNLAVDGPGAAITIAASNVSLDLGGHTIKGAGDKQGIGILIENVAGVRVHNGTLALLGVGEQVMGSHNVRIEDLQIHAGDGGGPPPGEVGVLVMNSRAVLVTRNVVSNTFLGIFVRGGGSGGNQIAMNTLTGGQNGQLGICYNPDGSGSPAGPSGDRVYNNLVSRFNVGIQTSVGTAGNIFRENDIAFVQQAVSELAPGTNIFEDNTTIQITP